MSAYRRIETDQVEGVTVVRFMDRKIIEAAIIQELGDELFALVDRDGRRRVLLDCSLVEFLSSAALNRMTMLKKKLDAVKGHLRLSDMKPEIYQVFAITRLNQFFDIKPTKEMALEDWPKAVRA